jgi:eukaryotic-like serine/threonine-protein kinase
MSLLAGTRIGPYEVAAPLGAGGMGEVYRARDARLKRDVALKILPTSVGDDPDRLARFEREAQALAALNHPNIAAIYGFEEGARAGESTVRALVLELVEGETLAERIARGPVPVSEALPIAKQIASALEAAHEQGIVHRDLKPANIKITPDGVVKVLDFGLAKLTDAGPLESGARVRSGSNPDLTPTIAASMSPTMTTPALTTGAGVLLGTAAYMSPEQARGRAADKRADIWAFGVVLYEMLTGSRAFGGDTVTETAGAVIHKELDLTAVPADLPTSARTVLRRCLQKDPLQRVRDIGDVRLALEGAFAPDIAAAPAAVVRTSPTRRLAEMGAVAVVVAIVAGGIVWWMTRPQPVARFPMRIDVPMGIGFAPLLDLSPDGRYFAVIGGTAQSEAHIWIHSLETGESRMLESAGVVRQPPFWSADGRSLGYVSEGRLKRVDIAGGAPQTICDVMQFGGGTWTHDNVILFSDIPKGGILQVPAAGGTPVQLTKPPADAKAVDALPFALPDGRHFLYIRIAQGTPLHRVLVGERDVKPDQQNNIELTTSTRHAIYAPPVDSSLGRLLFTRDNVLMSQAFDVQSRALAGDATPVVEQVAFANQIGAFAVSSNGTLAYIRGSSDTGSLVWVGRDGQQLTTVASNLKAVGNPRLSPDQKALAAVVGGDIWSYDIGGRPPIRLTFNSGSVHAPLFTKDGKRVIYESDKPRGLFGVPSDGSGGTPELVSPPGHYHPHGWSADGQQIVAARLPDETPSSNPSRSTSFEQGKSIDLVRFAATKDAAIQTIVETPATEGVGASLSPDGRWIAYTSDSTGSTEVWVRPFPGPGAPIRVSPNGGTEPLWSRSGKELYYLQGGSLMSVAIDTGGTFNFKPPTRLFESTYQRGTQPPTYDVAADGRFVMVKPDSQAGNTVSVILNWQELLRQKN